MRWEDQSAVDELAEGRNVGVMEDCCTTEASDGKAGGRTSGGHASEPKGPI